MCAVYRFRYTCGDVRDPDEIKICGKFYDHSDHYFVEIKLNIKCPKCS